MIRRLKFTFALVAMMMACFGANAIASAQEGSGDTSQKAAAEKVTKQKTIRIAGQASTIDSECRVIVVGRDGQNYLVQLDGENQEGEGVVPQGTYKLSVRPVIQGEHLETRTILVGPDGKREVVLLQDGEGEAQSTWTLGFAAQEGEGVEAESAQEPGDPDTTRVLTQLSVMTAGQYIIGVSCDEVSDALRAQLGIENGILVVEVVEDSPASGKIEVYDILVRAGDTELSDISSLIEAVQKAGEEEKELEIELMRRGESKAVSVTPKKREVASRIRELSAENIQVLQELNLDSHPGRAIVLESFGPGMVWRSGTDVIKGGAADDLRSQVEELRRQVEELRKQLEDR